MKNKLQNPLDHDAPKSISVTPSHADSAMLRSNNISHSHNINPTIGENVPQVFFHPTCGFFTMPQRAQDTGISLNGVSEPSMTSSVGLDSTLTICNSQSNKMQTMKIADSSEAVSTELMNTKEKSHSDDNLTLDCQQFENLPVISDKTAQKSHDFIHSKRHAAKRFRDSQKIHSSDSLDTKLQELLQKKTQCQPKDLPSSEIIDDNELDYGEPHYDFMDAMEESSAVFGPITKKSFSVLPLMTKDSTTLNAAERNEGSCHVDGRGNPPISYPKSAEMKNSPEHHYWFDSMKEKKQGLISNHRINEKNQAAASKMKTNLFASLSSSSDIPNDYTRSTTASNATLPAQKSFRRPRVHPIPEDIENPSHISLATFTDLGYGLKQAAPCFKEHEKLSELYLKSPQIGKEVFDIDIYRYFSQFGPIVNLHVAKDKTNERVKGFAFIRFERMHIADAVQNSRPHSINGYRIETQRSLPKWGKDEVQKLRNAWTVPIHGIAPGTTKKYLRKFFSHFGPVNYVNIHGDTAFISFIDTDPVCKIILIYWSQSKAATSYPKRWIHDLSHLKAQCKMERQAKLQNVQRAPSYGPKPETKPHIKNPPVNSRCKRKYLQTIEYGTKYPKQEVATPKWDYNIGYEEKGAKQKLAMPTRDYDNGYEENGLKQEVAEPTWDYDNGYEENGYFQEFNAPSEQESLYIYDEQSLISKDYQKYVSQPQHDTGPSYSTRCIEDFPMRRSRLSTKNYLNNYFPAKSYQPESKRSIDESVTFPQSKPNRKRQESTIWAQTRVQNRHDESMTRPLPPPAYPKHTKPHTKVMHEKPMTNNEYHPQQESRAQFHYKHRLREIQPQTKLDLDRSWLKALPKTTIKTYPKLTPDEEYEAEFKPLLHHSSLSRQHLNELPNQDEVQDELHEMQVALKRFREQLVNFTQKKHESNEDNADGTYWEGAYISDPV